MTPVVFDLDGTLIDSAPDIHLAVSRLLADHGLPMLDLATVTSFIGNGLPVLCQRVIAATDLPDDGFDTLYPQLSAHYDAVNGQLTRLYPGVAETLETLAARGHPLGLCTNKPVAPTRAILQAVGLDETFACVIGGDSLPERKPDPAGLHLCFEELGGQGAYVGDSEVDAETAVRAGTRFLLFTQGYRKTPVADLPHDAAFDDFAALPDLLTKETA